MGLTKCHLSVSMLMLFVLFSVAAIIVEGKPRLVIVRNEDDELVEVTSKWIVISNGQNLTLTCKAEDFEDRTVWMKETKDLKVFSNGPTLGLYPASILDSGKYICRSLKFNIDKPLTVFVKMVESLVRKKRVQYSYDTNFGNTGRQNSDQNNLGYYPHRSTFDQQKNSYIQSMVHSQINSIDSSNNYHTYYEDINNPYKHNKHEYDVSRNKKPVSATKSKGGFTYFIVAMAIMGLIGILVHLYKLATKGNRNSSQRTANPNTDLNLQYTGTTNGRSPQEQVVSRYGEYIGPLRRSASLPLERQAFSTVVVQDDRPTVTTTLITPTDDNANEPDLPPSYNTCDQNSHNMEPADLPPSYAEAIENMFSDSTISTTRLTLNNRESPQSLPRI